MSVVLTHRRFGKSTTILTHIAERSQREPGIVSRFGGVTQAKAQEIVSSTLNDIYQYTPQYRPRFTASEGVHAYRWQNGSELFVFGNSDAAECDKGRGTKISGVLYADERAFWRYRPEYMLRSILMPQVDNQPKAQVIITSSAPEDLTHPFLTEIKEAKANNYLYEQSIIDTVKMGDISQEEHDRIIQRCGGIESETYKREYLNYLIPTKSKLVIPEATDETTYVESIQRPRYFDYYSCLDFGLRDYTFAVFGYYHFSTANLIIEQEYQANYKSTKQISDELKQIESTLETPIYRRYADNELQQIYDLAHDHDYRVTPIIKRSKQSNTGFLDSVINNLRVAFSAGRIKINPRCTNLIAQLKYGIWNDRRNDFERSESLGHLDGIMALAYLWDNLHFERNPYPKIPEGTDRFNSSLDYDKEIQKSKTIKSLEQAFGGPQHGKRL